MKYLSWLALLAVGCTSTLTERPAFILVGDAGSVHVGDIDAKLNPSSTPAYPGFKKYTWLATVWVHDADHNPVEGAVVTATYAGITLPCTTKADGHCGFGGYFNRRGQQKFVVTVNDVSGAPYDAGSNHDPDGDSNGTTLEK